MTAEKVRNGLNQVLQSCKDVAREVKKLNPKTKSTAPVQEALNERRGQNALQTLLTSGTGPVATVNWAAHTDHQPLKETTLTWGKRGDDEDFEPPSGLYASMAAGGADNEEEGDDEADQENEHDEQHDEEDADLPDEPQELLGLYYTGQLSQKKLQQIANP